MWCCCKDCWGQCWVGWGWGLFATWACWQSAAGTVGHYACVLTVGPVCVPSVPACSHLPGNQHAPSHSSHSPQAEKCELAVTITPTLKPHRTKFKVMGATVGSDAGPRATSGLVRFVREDTTALLGGGAQGQGEGAAGFEGLREGGEGTGAGGTGKRRQGRHRRRQQPG